MRPFFQHVAKALPTKTEKNHLAGAAVGTAVTVGTFGNAGAGAVAGGLAADRFAKTAGKDWRHVLTYENSKVSRTAARPRTAALPLAGAFPTAGRASLWDPRIRWSLRPSAPLYPSGGRTCSIKCSRR